MHVTQGRLGLRHLDGRDAEGPEVGPEVAIVIEVKEIVLVSTYCHM